MVLIHETAGLDREQARMAKRLAYFRLEKTLSSLFSSRR
jgi:hypothetical protein